MIINFVNIILLPSIIFVVIGGVCLYYYKCIQNVDDNTSEYEDMETIRHEIYKKLDADFGLN